MSFGIYAGVKLWRIRSGAVTTARIYLLCLLAYNVGSLGLPFLLGLPSEYSQRLLMEAVPGFVPTMIGIAIWYSYLTQSRRVRATYAPLDLETAAQHPI
jgi:hypothetical protein